MEPVSVIINVFNEADTIENEIRDIYQTIINRIPSSELIVAEDGSTDGTSAIIKRLVTQLGVIHSTSIERKGYSKAFRDAIQLARNPWIFYSDTGGKNDFSDFWKLYQIRKEADLVIGNRSGRTDQLYRKMLTWVYNLLLNIYFGVHVKDADSGFRLYKTSLLKKIALQEWINKDLISSEIVIRMYRLGAKIKEVPIVYKQRKGISRGLPLKKIPKVVVRVLRNLPRLKKALDDLSHG